MFPDVPLDGRSKAQVESAEIHQHNHLGLPLDGLLEERVKKAFELPILRQRFRQPEHRVRGQIDEQFHTRVRHARSSGAEEFRRPRHALDFRQLPKGLDQLGREQVATGFAGNQHEVVMFHSD
jgi:hypothetical protein